MIDVADIREAAKRIAGTITETPCPYSETLSELTGARVFVKLENLQMTGSFKERGAANLLLQLSPAERRRGVIAASAGNHGLAVAFHAARLGIAAVIVMPEWAPLAKVTAARRHGAEVVLHGENFDEAYVRAREIEAARHLVFVHPFDDDRVIAGQGTIGLEMIAQVPGLDAVLVPVGGGGLIGGIAADSLAPKRVGSLMFPIAQRYVTRTALVTDDAIRASQRALWKSLRIVAEPGGAAALAALMSGAWAAKPGEKVGVLLCGGNTTAVSFST